MKEESGLIINKKFAPLRKITFSLWREWTFIFMMKGEKNS
jgi:hypothetical protein